ncbi:MAG: hypothetical protein IJH40_09550 [Ruminococcus sp.]|uniref:dockerin type I domain-containing protein n=1 Tax=Ruminococcus sp. TaxID=41978 RepID=UPI002872B7D1|nr:dockerin type I domain-containing protein [Ruminococcus sp.]MBQ3285869.1 hypothetical protein [Ruminococcus sp.]
MKKMMKILTVMLAVCVLFAALPLTVHAEPTAYDLWIGNTQVTAANCGDIPSVTEGHASFDPVTNTLTLNEVGKVFGQTNSSVIYSMLDRLNIRLIGKNVLDYYYLDGVWYAAGSTWYERNNGIRSTGSLTFTDGGRGSLMLYGFECPIDAYGKSVTVESGVYLYIDMYGQEMYFPVAVDCGCLTVSGGELEIDGRYRDTTGDSSYSDFGGDVYSYAEGVNADSFTMTDGSVRIVNAEKGISAGQSITISGGKLDISSGGSCVSSDNDIDISGRHTRLELCSGTVAMYGRGSLNISGELSILSPVGGSIGTWYGFPAIVNADGSGAKNVLIETAQSSVVDNIWLTMTMPEAGDSRSDIEASVKVVPEDESLYRVSSLSFGEVLENGVDWGVTSFEGGKTYVLDVCVNTYDGITLLGGGTDSSPDHFHAYVNDMEIAPEIYQTTVCRLYYYFTLAQVYHITVNGGRAYDDFDSITGEPVTAVKEKGVVIVMPDAVPGKYVTGWTAEPEVDFVINDGYLAAFLMPDSDVALTPVYADQMPVVHDLRNGGTDIDGTLMGILTLMYRPDKIDYSSGEEITVDLDGDSFDDIGMVWTWNSETQEDSCKVYPLESTKLSGIYTVSEPNISPCYPVRFIFPSNSNNVTLLIDTGTHGEDISLEVPRGTRISDALFESGIYEELEAMDSENYFCRGDVTTKPFSEFTDEDEFYEDTNAIWLGTANEDMVLYACFLERIKTVELTLKRPVAGTTVTVDENYVQDPSPEITLAPDQYCYLHEEDTYIVWTAGVEDYEPFAGTFIEGESYYTTFYIWSDFRYYIGNDATVIAHGATVEEAYGEMGLMVTLSAKAISPAILGDADGDGNVTVMDVTWIQRKLANSSVPDTFDETAADVDGDGKVTVMDVTYIQRYNANMTVPYPIGEPIA